MGVLQAKELVAAGLYPDEQAVVRDALRALLVEKPQLRLEIAVYQYRTEKVSLARAAALAGVSWERMREIIQHRGISLLLGPENLEEAIEEIASMEHIVHESTD